MYIENDGTSKGPEEPKNIFSFFLITNMTHYFFLIAMYVTLKPPMGLQSAPSPGKGKKLSQAP